MAETLRRKMPRPAMPRRLRILLRDPATVLGLAIVVVAVAGAIAAPLIAPHDPTAVDTENRLLSPDREFPLGTDHLGRDEFSRLVFGARTTMGTAGVVLAVVFAIALTVGTMSGYYGGWIDTLLMGLVDLLLAFPGLILAIAIAGDPGSKPDQCDDRHGGRMVGRLCPAGPRHGALNTAAGVCGSSTRIGGQR